MRIWSKFSEISNIHESTRSWSCSSKGCKRYVGWPKNTILNFHLHAENFKNIFEKPVDCKGINIQRQKIWSFQHWDIERDFRETDPSQEWNLCSPSRRLWSFCICKSYFDWKSHLFNSKAFGIQFKIDFLETSLVVWILLKKEQLHWIFANFPYFDYPIKYILMNNHIFLQSSYQLLLKFGTGGRHWWYLEIFWL